MVGGDAALECLESRLLQQAHLQQMRAAAATRRNTIETESFVFHDQDFHGQKLSEALYYYIIIICGAIGWIVGFAKESFLYTFYGWAIGMVLSLLVCCPDWPFYNRHKVEWLVEIPKPGRGVAEAEPRKASTSSASASGGTASGSKKDKKSKKA